MKHILKKLLRHRTSEQNAPTAPESRKRRRKNPIGLVIALFLIVGGVVGGQYLLSQRNTSVGSTRLVNSTGTKQEVPIDRKFSFEAFDRSKKLSDRKIEYTITSAEVTNQIVLKGKRATAVNGRTFLIIGLKLTNEHDESLFLNTRNFIRVQPVGSSDKLAPEIHNDTVEIQPDSTKLTRVGMPIDAGQKRFMLFVGAIEADEKEQIEISFE